MPWTTTGEETKDFALDGEFAEYINEETGGSFGDFAEMYSGIGISQISYHLGKYIPHPVARALHIAGSALSIDALIDLINAESHRQEREDVLEEAHKNGGSVIRVRTVLSKLQW
ncbi:hypothetical protein J2S78_002761 [Salibacterium salarium]|uniref:hypothetical protein n=1 Tax=Salibacterium salarium TaxID=284579 RepID=UPI002785B5A3|nr:hypothetical protein [Salibacterium salarium]MDQ0300314.1 hypothetical protein [Salibacterium salarium]